MRIFNNPMEMIREVERDLHEMGIEVISESVQDKKIEDKTKELSAYGYTLTNFDYADLKSMIEYMGGNIDWCNLEFSERISSDYINPGFAYTCRLNIWEQYLHDNRFSYTYNERYRDQLEQLINEATVRPFSRQLVLTGYDKHHDLGNIGGQKRIPCTMHTQYLIRENKINAIYVMRSCDFLKHFVHDVALSCLMLEYLSKRLHIKQGYFTHFIGSLHAFKSDLDTRGIF